MSEELREKVINGLECVIWPNKVCGDCSYFIPNEDDPDTGWCNRDAIYKDALSLLKAQEPILLENQHKPYGHIINANSPWISRCPKCGKKIEGKQTRFCKYCGQAVKWDANE